MRFLDLVKFALARFKRDLVGNIIGLIGPDNLLRKLGFSRAYTMLVAGDSITAFSESTVTATSIVDNGNGTATVVKAAHGLSPGQPIRMNVTAAQKTNVMDSVILSVIDANTFTIQLGGRTHKVVGGGAPNYILPWRRASKGWFGHMEERLGVTFKTVWCAVGGATSSQIYDLVVATPLTEIQDIGIVYTGMNDPYNGLDFPTAQADRKKLIDAVRARSALTVVVAIPPRNSADTTYWTAARQAVHTKLNRWAHQYAQQIGAIFYDPSGATWNGKTYIDPTAANPDPYVPYMFDNTHPAHPAAKAVGYGIGDAIQPFMGVKAWKPWHKSQIGADTGNLVVNADWSSNAGGLPTNWTIVGQTAGTNLTTTIVPRSIANGDSDNVGNNAVITFNFGTATGTLAQFSFQRSGIQGLLTPGSTVQWKMLSVAIQNAIGLLATEITISGIANGLVWQAYSGGLDGNTKPVAGSWTAPLAAPPVVVPAGLTSANILVRVLYDNTQTTDGTVKFAQPELLTLA